MQVHFPGNGEHLVAGRLRKKASLLAGTISTTALLACLAASPAAAQGGGTSGTLISGGADSATGTGGQGGDNTGQFEGGGGGGAGATGGAGGLGHGQAAGSRAAGGTAPGGDGADGAGGPGGNGGGGGAHGSVGGLPAVATVGGDGGDGGVGSTFDGGGGGAGGWGAVVTTPGAAGTLTVNVTGGVGGNGASSALNFGGGGSGGVGLATTAATSLTISSTVTGGNGGNGPTGGFTPNRGGAGGTGVQLNTGVLLINTGTIIGGNGGTADINGAGGVGIVGAGVTVVNSGTITGGTNGGGGQANAITFTSGTNLLELQAGSTISGNVVAAATANDTLRLGGTTNATFAANEIGSKYQNFDSFVKTGSSIWTLTGATAATTAWTINQGTLEVSADGNLGATTGTLTLDGGTLRTTATFSTARAINMAGTGSINVFNAGTTMTVSGTVSGTGILSKTGAGTLVLSGTNTHSGGVGIMSGTLEVQGGNAIGDTSNVAVGGSLVVTNSETIGALQGSGSVILAAGQTLTTGGGGASTNFTGVISGGGALTKTGASTFTLSGANTYSGVTTVSGGTLAISGAGTLGASSGATIVSAGILDLGATTQTQNGGVTLTGGTIQNGTLSSSGTFGLQAGTVSAALAGTGGVAKTGVGTVVFSGANTYSGGTTVSGGTLQLSGTGTLGLSSGTSTVSGGTLSLGGTSQTQDGGVTLTAGTITNGTLSSLGTFGLQAGAVSATLAGTGGVNKTTSGTVTLSGANTYFGGTTVAAGTLQLGGVGTLGAIGGATTVAGGTLDLGGTSQTQDGGVTLASGIIQNGSLSTASTFNLQAGTASAVLGGAGAATKTTAGIVTLSGANTYTGPTTVAAGTLLVNGSIASSVTAFVLPGATIGGTGFLPSTTVGGTLSPGNSPGTLTVNGNLTLNPGSISLFELSTPGVIGAGVNDLVVVNGNLVLDGTLQTPGAPVSGLYRLFNVTGTTTGAFAAVPAGATVITAVPNQVDLLLANAGQLVQFWDGPNLVANGTVDGGTGTWNLANTNWTGVPDNATNTPWLSQVGVFMGAAGTVTVASPLSFQGLQFKTTGYTVTGGTLTMTGDPAGNAAASFVNVDAGVEATIASTLAGAAGLDKIGAGTLLLTGTNSYTGATTVNGGLLTVDGSIATSSLTTVNPGSTLGGIGTVGNATIGGTLAPGNSIGTMTVAGNLVFSAGSKYAVEVSPDATDRTNVTGTATLSGGTVVVTYLPGTFVAKDYVILNAAGGLAGTKFAGLQAAALPGLVSSLTYDATNVHLVTSVERTVPPFNGLNPNQQAVASTLLDYFNANGSLPAEFAGLDANGLTIVSGELATGAINAGIDSADQFLGALDGQMETGGSGGAGQGGAAAYAEESKADDRFASLGMSASHNADQVEQVFAKRWNVWGTFYGGSEVIDGDLAVGSHTTTADTWGLVGGVSLNTEDTLVGIGLGGGTSDFSLSDGLGDGSANTFNAGIYGRQGFGNAYVSGALAYGFHDVETDRTVFGEVLSGDFNANSYSGRGEAGYRFDAPLVAISPYAAFQATAYHLPDYTETSSGAGTFALHYNAETTTATRVELGARLEHAMALSDGGLLTLTGRAAWAINGGTARNVGAAFQSLPGTAFTIDGAEPDANSALLDAGAEYAAPSGFFAAATFQSEFSGNVQMYAGKLKLGFKW